MTPAVAAGLLSTKRLLIFDLDGTLIDSSPIHARAFREAFAVHGVEPDYDLIAGLTTEAAIDRISAAAGLVLDGSERRRLAADKRARALKLIKEGVEPLAGAVDFVHAAHGRFELALCTSASRLGAEAALSRVGLRDVFMPIITAELVHRGKPDPEAFVLALKAHAASPEESLVFEDAASGLEAAAAANIDAVRIGSKSNGGTGWDPFAAALTSGFS